MTSALACVCWLVVFHTVFDLDDRYQVPGARFIRSRRTYEKDGTVARWRGIHDDHGRVIVAICHNMDLGDSWEHADNPRYPQEYSALVGSESTTSLTR